ncbi:MAG: glutamine amidotransferase [Bacteroidales bacterium]|jgi:putative intracellular protease/amidase|nr:glutamine amidotransferase [Bacteroidales bacterium]
MKKKIMIFLFDGFSDWEIAYLTPEIRKNKTFDLVYFSYDGNPVFSMGGLRVMPDISLKDIHPEEVEMLILPGGTAWEEGENDFMDALVKDLLAEGKTVAAICAATAYLGKKGYLNDRKHTSNDLYYLKGIAPEYSGEKDYVNDLAVTGRNIITAKGIAPIEFAREIFAKLELYQDNDLEKWFQLFKNGIWSE